MKVLIKIMNLNHVLNIYADNKENEIIINNKPINYDAKKFVDNILIITSNWKNSYYNGRILDGEEFRIKLISDNNEERLIVGKNSFPSNYDDFKKIINEVLKLWN